MSNVFSKINVCVIFVTWLIMNEHWMDIYEFARKPDISWELVANIVIHNVYGEVNYDKLIPGFPHITNIIVLHQYDGNI